MNLPERSERIKSSHPANVVVVIPVHSAQPTSYELISFEQCFRIFSTRVIKVLAPAGLNLEAYRRVVDFDVVYVDPKWQASIAAYNKLKISRYFYRLFHEYEYLLTYELDCFAFRDELDYWCEKGYDYIGAPWFEGYSALTPDAPMIGVGNSGFSLRNIQTARKILGTIFYQNPMDDPLPGMGIALTYVRVVYRWLRNKFGENYTLRSAGNIHEDFFFSEVAPRYFSDYRLPLVDEALKFSFEVNPRILFSLNDNGLPMGCHAWWRYDLAFWAPYIRNFGYELAI